MGKWSFPQLYFMFYVLLLNVPSSIIGSYFGSPAMLYITAALDLTPLMFWFSLVRYGPFYWAVLIFEVRSFLFVHISVAHRSIVILPI
jgi:hypothetical protein